MKKKNPSKESLDKNVATSSEKNNTPQSEPHEDQKNTTYEPTINTQPQHISDKDLLSAIFNRLAEGATDDQKKICDKTIRNYIIQSVVENSVLKKYNVIILHDEGRMVKSDADNIYNAITDFKEEKSILLVLYSTGGSIASAYLIGKLCRENSHDDFVVVVPRQAKSAATLICCAADQIHMGSLSELGPIDPQIDELPALGLKNSVEHLAELVKRYPEASDMFAKYLSISLKPIHLGYYERVAESASQYAERLLQTHASNLKGKPKQIAHDLVYNYKDHAFVIDKREAEDIFGDNIIKTKTQEYNLGNSIYQVMSLISRIADLLGHYFYFIGSLDGTPIFKKRN